MGDTTEIESTVVSSRVPAPLDQDDPKPAVGSHDVFIQLQVPGLEQIQG